MTARMTARSGHGEKNQLTRSAILDATEQILREEGYAAVSSRKVAAKAGLKSQLVHYHFGTMDDLFLALFRRVEEQHFHLLAQAMASKQPLRALWELSIDAGKPRLSKDFIALATHHEALRTEIARSTERTRSLQVAALRRILEERAMSTDAFPPAALAILMEGAARLMVSETALGTTAGHAETIAFVEAQIDRLESAPPNIHNPVNIHP